VAIFSRVVALVLFGLLAGAAIGVPTLKGPEGIDGPYTGIQAPGELDVAVDYVSQSEQVKLTFSTPAYVDMPIWVTLTFPEKYNGLQANLRYPFREYPWFTWGHTFEVMRDGKLLPPCKTSAMSPMAMNGLAGGSCAPSSSPKGRLPLHVFYRFDQPGTYQVRYVDKPLFPAEDTPTAPVLTSAWVTLEVKPYSIEDRKKWQQAQMAHPPTDPGLLVGDYLPSLLASPDETVLPAFVAMLHHPNTLVQGFAFNCLAYYDEPVLCQAVLDTLRKHGPTELLAYAMSWHRAALKPHGQELVDLLLPALTARDPKQASSAVRALGFLHGESEWGFTPELRQRIETAVLQAAPGMRALHDQETDNALACFLGTIKSDQSRALLRQMVGDGSEQALICLCGLADPRDLPRLGEILHAGGAHADVLPYALHHAYDEAALPVIIQTLHDSTDARLRRECAKELLYANRLEGFTYFRDLLAQPEPGEALFILRDFFPGQHNHQASAEELRALVDERIRQLGDQH